MDTELMAQVLSSLRSSPVVHKLIRLGLSGNYFDSQGVQGQLTRFVAEAVNLAYLDLGDQRSTEGEYKIMIEMMPKKHGIPATI